MVSPDGRPGPDAQCGKLYSNTSGYLSPDPPLATRGSERQPPNLTPPHPTPPRPHPTPSTHSPTHTTMRAQDQPAYAMPAWAPLGCQTLCLRGPCLGARPYACVSPVWVPDPRLAVAPYGCQVLCLRWALGNPYACVGPAWVPDPMLAWAPFGLRWPRWGARPSSQFIVIGQIFCNVSVRSCMYSGFLELE